MLENWKKYIDDAEYCRLIDFVKSTENNIPLMNKFLIICGKASTGKSTLSQDIQKIIGMDNVMI